MAPPARYLAAACLVVGCLAFRRVQPRAWVSLVLFLLCGALALGSQRSAATSGGGFFAPYEAVIEGGVCNVETRSRSVWVDLCDAVNVTDSSSVLPRRIRIRESVDRDIVDVLSEQQVGQRIRARLRMMPIRAESNPGTRSNPNFYFRRGIGAFASMRGAAMIVRVSGESRRLTPWIARAWAPVNRVRSEIGARLIRRGRGGALVQALALGDRSSIPASALADFAQLGISHLLAVSGLHVGLAAGFGFALVRRGCLRFPSWVARNDPRRMALAGAMVLATVYALMAGWGVPVRRALLFLVVLCGSIASRRTVHPVQLLALAALPLLVAEPHVLFDLGAQLSFVASAGLLLARGGGEMSSVESLLRVSATAILATAPLLALHGAGSGVFGVVANLIAVPWVAVVLLPGALIAACVAALPEVWLGESIIAIVLLLCEWSLDAGAFAAAHLPPVAAGAVPTTWALVVAGALALGGLCVGKTSRRVGICVLASGLLALAPAKEITPAPPRVVMFDVGQGDAVLVQGRSAAVLVDGGRTIGTSLDLGRTVVVPGLAALGVARLDVVIASHADIDHRGGLVSVLEAVATEELWLPRGARAAGDFGRLLEVANRLGVKVREVDSRDDAWRRGDLRVEPLWPDSQIGSASRNDSSLVVRVEVFDGDEVGDRVLLTGDIGAPAEQRLLEAGEDLSAAVLKVGHHGSQGSSTLAFLAAVGPEVALVSSPCHGRGGLPNHLAMKRLSSTSDQLWWTGQSGAVVVGLRTRARPRVVEGWRPIVQCWMHESRATRDAP